MLKARLILLGALAALALSGLAAATASAHEYIVESKPVTELVHGTFTSGRSVLEGHILGDTVEIVSTLDTGTFSIGPNGTSTFEISFTGNSVSELNAKGELVDLTKCSVPSLITFHGTDQLLESSSQWLDTFTGSAPPIFTEFKIEGSECALHKAAAYKAEGTVNAILIEPEVEKELHIIEFNGAHAGSQALKFNNEPATFSSVESEVIKGKKWSGK